MTIVLMEFKIPIQLWMYVFFWCVVGGWGCIKFFWHTTFCIKQYLPREFWRDPSNHRLYERGIWYIYISDTTRTRTSNMFRHKHVWIYSGYHSDGYLIVEGKFLNEGNYLLPAGRTPTSDFYHILRSVQDQHLTNWAIKPDKWQLILWNKRCQATGSLPWDKT